MRFIGGQGPIGRGGLWFGAARTGPSISAALEYTRAATDTVKIKLDNARNGLPGDVLALTALTLDGADATGNVAEALTSPELADTTAPGALTGASGQKVTAMSSVSSGVLYLISYEVTAADEGVTLFYPSAGPFGTGNLPTSLGIQNVLVTAEDGDTGNAINKGGTGDITISAMSIKRAEWNYTATGASAGEAIAFTITRGEVTTSGSVTVPVADEFYVHGGGSDTLGTGSIAAPYRTPQFALAQGIGAGDTMLIGAGVYDPFDVEASGSRCSTITITAIPGQEYEGIIRGELQSHVAQGGSVESTLPESKRDGIYIDSQDWIIVEKLTIEWVWRTGVFVVGTVSEQHGHHIIRDNIIRDVGRSAVYVGGNNSSSVIPSGETSSLRTIDVLVEENDITRTNLEIDVQGLGNVECISAAASASSIVAKGNTIYNSRQYGIDFKAGVNGSYTPVSGDVNFAYGPGNFIEENTITNTERHGIYIDAGQRFCEDITIRNNTVTGCRHGIVLARENGAGSNAFLSLDSIDIFNNVIVDSDQIGIYYHNHPGDTDTGTISNIRTRFNTVVNSNRETGFKDLNLDDWSENFSTATMTGNDFSGNLVYSDQEMDMAVNLTGGWSLAENFNVVDGTSTGTDPDFVDADNGDYTPQAAGTLTAVTTASLINAPFNLDANGATRALGPVGAVSVTPDPVVISAVTVSAFASGDLPISITASGAVTGNGVYWVIEPDGDTGPNATEIVAGQASGGGSPAESGNDTWPGPFTDTLTTGLARGDYKLYAVIVNAGGNSNVGTSAAFEVDTTAPSLTSPTSSALTETTATVTVTSNDTVGTLYWGVYPTASTPTAAQIIAGTGATDSGSTASPAASTNDFSATGLIGSTAYKAHFVQVDDYDNESTIATSAEFTTSAAAGSLARGTTTQLVDSATIKTTFTSGSDGGSSVTPAAGSNRMLTFVTYWTNRDTAPASTPTLSFGGVSATLVDSYISPSGYSPCYMVHKIAEADIPAGASATTVTAPIAIYRVSTHLLEYSGVAQTTPFGPAVNDNINSSVADITLNVTVSSSVMLSGAYWRSGATLAPVTTTTDSGGTITEIVERQVTGDDVNGLAVIADEMVGSTGNVTHTFTANQGIPWTSFAVEVFEA